jgi:hypothetical protein
MVSSMNLCRILPNMPYEILSSKSRVYGAAIERLGVIMKFWLGFLMAGIGAAAISAAAIGAAVISAALLAGKPVERLRIT